MCSRRLKLARESKKLGLRWFLLALCGFLWRWLINKLPLHLFVCWKSEQSEPWRPLQPWGSRIQSQSQQWLSQRDSKRFRMKVLAANPPKCHRIGLSEMNWARRHKQIHTEIGLFLDLLSAICFPMPFVLLAIFFIGHFQTSA